MSNPTLAKKYLSLALGGNMDEEEQAKFAGTSATVAGLGSGLLDAFDQPNEYGNQSVGTTAGKSALSFGAAGASIGGPVGAGVGAALGLTVGLLNGFKQKRQENSLRSQKFAAQHQSDMNRSAAQIASDPTLISGYKNTQLFAGGGTMVPSQVNATGDKSLDTVPSYLYYIKAMQEGNMEGANKAIAHVNSIRGSQTGTALQFLGKSMKTSDVFSLAKRNIVTETDPQMKLLYTQLNENGPDLLKNFQYSLPMKGDNAVMATRASGGPIGAPLANAYMKGGKAQSLSSNSTEILGNSHKEGGVAIPQMGAEVEDGETTADNYVFSKELGFADLHKPIAKMKGKIEQKPQTIERRNAMKLLNQKEQQLALSQEYLKQRLGIQ